MEIYYTTRFVRNYKKLPQEIKEKAKVREVIFRQNPFDPLLKTHKLSGELKDYWSFSVDHSYRIIFEMPPDKDVFVFDTIGTHKVYE